MYISVKDVISYMLVRNIVSCHVARYFCPFFLSLFISLSSVPPRGQQCRAMGQCERLYCLDIAAALLPLPGLNILSREGVRSEGDELSLKKPRYQPEAGATTSVAVLTKMRLHMSRVERKSG